MADDTPTTSMSADERRALLAELEAMALCQGCCRLHPIAALIPDANHPGTGMCPICGAEACHCRGCLASVAALVAGDWEAARLQPHAARRAISWTADGGLIMREATP